MRTAVVVDDELIIRMDVAQMLKDIGFEVVGEAADGFDAIEVCRAKHPDVVLMDIKMPVFDGLYAAEVIINEKIAGCVVLLTAFSDKELLDEANRIGVTGYLTKPVNQKLLLPVIEVAISQSNRLMEADKKIEEVQKKLADNRLIERAKTIIAKEKGIPEYDAYKELQQLSMNKRCSIATVAKAVIENKSERELINRAKEILMKQKGFSEQDAYKYLSKKAISTNCSKAEISRKIISSFGRG